MSIRLRFTVALTLLGLILFGGYAVLSYRGEQDDLRTATDLEIRKLGRSLATSLANALRDRQRADVDGIMRALESLEPHIHIHVHDIDGHEIARSRDAAIDEHLETVVRRAATAHVELTTFEPDVVIYAAPLIADSGAPLGAIAVTRELSDLNADLARTRWRLIIVVVAFVALTMIAGLLLGTAYVTRPLATVLDGISHVRDGDYASRVPVVRHDEIGALVDEFNAMVAALAAARLRVDQETEARLRLERGLQGVDKMITIGQLSAGLAHEIGSPLHVLSARAQALLDHGNDAESRRIAQILVEQSDRIARIVEQLLSFGRRRTALIAPCDLAVPVRTVLELLAGEARRRGIALALEVEPGPRDSIDADADQIQQIALNLIKNALYATSSGGSIVVRVETAETTVRLVVRDTGTGIPHEMQAKLFEPFFTTRASEGGTGLGLAVVRSIAVEHGGSIAVTSEPGHGAEFVVSFPRPRHG